MDWFARVRHLPINRVLIVELLVPTREHVTGRLARLYITHQLRSMVEPTVIMCRQALKPAETAELLLHL